MYSILSIIVHFFSKNIDNFVYLMYTTLYINVQIFFQFYIFNMHKFNVQCTKLCTFNFHKISKIVHNFVYSKHILFQRT